MSRVAKIALVALSGCFAQPSAPDGDAAGARDIQFVQSQGTFVGSTDSASVTLLHTSASHLLVLVVGTFPASASAPDVADNGGDTFTKASASYSTLGGSVVRIYDATTVAAEDTLTVFVTAAGASEVTLVLHEYSGADPIAPLDREQQAVSASASTTPDSGPVTTTLPGELYVGVATHDLDATTTAGTGYTLREHPTDSAVFVPLATEDKTGPAQTTSATFALDAATNWGCAIVTFR